MRITISMTVLVMAVAGTASAQIAPAFSVARGGPSGLDPSRIYSNEGGVATAFAAGPGSGLVWDGANGDAINGFSQRELIDEFLFCFSVDGRSTGIIGLDPVAAFPFAPFNVTNQAERGQASGDAFLSTKAFNRFSGMLGVGPSMPDRNNVLAINQSPSYFADFALKSIFNPDIDAAGEPMDDVEGGGSKAALDSEALFFTLDDESSTWRSNLVIIDDNSQIGGGEGVFMDGADFGLGRGDDIDAMSIFDDDDGVFSSGDQLLFSLAPGSTFLDTMGWSAADVLTFSHGDSGISLFARYSDLGLAFDDNLNMLELVPMVGDAENTIRIKVPAPGTMTLLGMVCALGSSRRRR